LSLQNLVEGGFLTLGTKFTEAFDCQEEAMKERDQKTGEAYLSLAQGLMGEGSSPARRTFRRNWTLEEDKYLEEQEDQDGTTNRVMARPHSLVMKHKSIYTIYHEWYGLEHFENLPVDGSIASLEVKYKTKWRSHFSPAEKQYFLWLQKVVKAIDEQGKHEAKEPYKVLNDWDALYQGEAKLSVMKMAMLVRSSRWVW
jgi:hypothetical protein